MRIDGAEKLKTLTDRATYARLEKDLSAVKNDISTLTDQITDVLNSFAGDASKQARRGLKQARSNADSMWSDAQQRGSQAYDAAYSMEETVEDAIHQRPLAAVGLALGVGILIGAAWRR